MKFNIRPITDSERRALYGGCVVCGATRDAYEVTTTEGEHETTELRLVCTATVRPLRDDWGHPQ